MQERKASIHTLILSERRRSRGSAESRNVRETAANVANMSEFTELRAGPLQSTLDRLQHRIAERFPDSGLSRVARELRALSNDVVTLTSRLRRPVWFVRVGAAIAGLALLVLTAFVIAAAARRDSGISGGFGLLQATETAVNEFILLALALIFLARIEARWKRRKALASLHRLRSVAHVVDMHQLTKDPSVLTQTPRTDSSPDHSMAPYELTRYLDYCSELLAHTSKLAALHAQGFDDAAVLAAVNDVESLTQGLSAKIWQKIMILDLATRQNLNIDRPLPPPVISKM
jgi:hypothetical protein